MAGSLRSNHCPNARYNRLILVSLKLFLLYLFEVFFGSEWGVDLVGKVVVVVGKVGVVFGAVELDEIPGIL
jgi:hypothetical protein